MLKNRERDIEAHIFFNTETRDDAEEKKQKLNERRVFD